MATQPKRATIYLDERLHKALKLKAIEGGGSVSELVNEAVHQSLKEDSIDLTALRDRKNEPIRPFEHFLKDLKKRGLL